MYKVLFGLSSLMALAAPASAQEAGFPQIVRTRYEALDMRLGGRFVLWSEREKIDYGLDPKLYPGATSVDVTQVTAAPGAFAMTYVEIKTTVNQTPDYLYFVGPARFRMTGMVLKSSNFPAGSMTPQR